MLNQYPAQKQGIINTLVHRARSICELEQLEELHHLRMALRGTGYTKRNIEKDPRDERKGNLSSNDISTLHIQMYDEIECLLRR